MTPSGSKWRTTGLARSVVDGLIALTLAPLCAACRRPLEEPTRGAVCGGCWAAIVPTTPLGSGAFPPAISLATAVGPYEDRLKDVIHALKYDPRPTIARHLALRMRDAGLLVLAGADAVVPVPLHRVRSAGDPLQNIRRRAVAFRNGCLQQFLDR